MADSENERLKREIAYYSEAIKSYTQAVSNKATSSQRRTVRPYSASSSKYSLVRNHQPKSQKETPRSLGSRTVLPAQTSVPASTRRVVLSAGCGSTNRRKVVNPSAVTNLNSAVLPTNNQFTSQNKSVKLKSQSAAASSPECSNSSINADVVKSHLITHKSKSALVSSRYPPRDGKFVWVNKNLLPKGSSPTRLDAVKTSNSTTSSSTAPVSKSSSNDILGNTSKLVDSQDSLQSTGGRLHAVGKYKLVKSNKLTHSPHRKPYSKTRATPHISKSGKRLISKYKIRRRSAEERKTRIKRASTLGESPALKSPRNRLSRYKVDHRDHIVVHTRYKIDKLKHTRKPTKVLSTKKSKPDRRSLRWVRSGLKESYHTFMSPFKLVSHSRSCRDAKADQSRKRTASQNFAVRKLASRSLQKSAARSIRAKYRKNNTNEKQCLFYMRFGKCNRGDKCFYIHDPERVAVCTRYLRGTCTIENCLFSHEAKKEKVPVCQHFLRGCCLRDNCPYLHVNVGKDAPICKSFAEFRYCHLGEKCKKLHTDICPNRDDNGRCPKGTACRLRHPKRISKQTLKHHGKTSHREGEDSTLTPSTSDSTNEEIERVVLPLREKPTEGLPAFISLSDISATELGERKNETKKLKTKPDFL